MHAPCLTMLTWAAALTLLGIMPRVAAAAGDVVVSPAGDDAAARTSGAPSWRASLARAVVLVAGMAIPENARGAVLAAAIAKILGAAASSSTKGDEQGSCGYEAVHVRVSSVTVPNGSWVTRMTRLGTGRQESPYDNDSGNRESH